MDYTIDLTFLEQLATQSPWEIFWFIFAKEGWVLFVFIFLWIAWRIFVNYKENKYAAAINYILLAIDVPKENVQSPKAVEQIFSYLAGIHSERSWVEKKLRGSFQESFSLELISLDGYIQFLIRTPDYFRDVIEAAIYSQYPEAEIVEVADYTQNVPKELPNEEYDLWGTELKLVNNDAYPIRTYPAFEHPLSQEFKDPLGPLLEALAKFQKGEQFWIQYIITPTGISWTKKGEKLIKEIMDKAAGIKALPKETLLDSLTKFPIKFVGGVGENVGDILMKGAGISSEETGAGAKAKVEAKVMPAFPPPREKGAAEAVQFKISKIGFETKIRVIYLGKREIFSKPKRIPGFFGGIKQFNTLDLNAFKPVGTVSTSGVILWDLINWGKKKLWRQKKVLRAFRNRSTKIGPNGFILNIEELASIWHFPTETVKAPLIKKTEAKRAEPPFTLPTEEETVEEEPVRAKAEPPENLPVVE